MGIEGSTDQAPQNTRPGFFGWVPGLSSRLFLLAIAFVLIAEALIFLPSAGNFRTSWLNERVEMAQTAVLALEAAPERRVSTELSRRLLENAQIVAVAAGSEMGRELILSPAMDVEGPVRQIDLRGEGLISRIRSAWDLTFDAETQFLVLTDTPDFEGIFIEVVVEAPPLRQALIDYCNRILWLSLFISGVVGLFIYLTLVALVVRPIRRITKSIERFRDDPKDWVTRAVPSNRQDEIGRAQTALADMETAVKGSLRQRERLAQLGEGMAKINHDLRNSLAAAQIVSDGLALSEDPRVQRAAPRLERAIERAIALAEDTLRFGRAEPSVPKIHLCALHTIVDEAADEGLAQHPGIMFANEVPEGLEHRVDPDHLHRILVNLIRNAGQALSSHDQRVGPGHIAVTHRTDGDDLIIEVADDGPGIPERAKAKLFQAFAGSASRGGSGLGLAIARELALGIGGDLRLARTGERGTAFELVLREGA